jgi:hypothetical protein
MFPERSKFVSALAAACVLTAFLQVAAGLFTVNQYAQSGLLENAGRIIGMPVLLAIGIGASLNLGAGVALYLMRIEALAFLGCSLARRCQTMAGHPVQLMTVIDLGIHVAVVWFSIRLFVRSSPDRVTGAPAWRPPLAMLLTGLAAGHLIVLVSEWNAFRLLLPTGSVPPLVALAGLGGSALLYAGASMIHWRPKRAGQLLLLAAIALGLSIPGWRSLSILSAPFWLGVPIAVFGFGVTRHGF